MPFTADPVTDNISPLKVLHSNAGYYVGRTQYNPSFECDLPYSRDSDYFKTPESAATHLIIMNVRNVLQESDPHLSFQLK